jgi:hypothetical protein
MDAILDKYGSIGASSYAIDVCVFSLETGRGMWASQPPIKPKGISRKKRTIGVVEFRYFTEAQGRFMHLLPKKEDDEPPTVLPPPFQGVGRGGDGLNRLRRLYPIPLPIAPALRLPP